MVLLHNRLNEDAWNEVLQWESRFHGGYEHISLEISRYSLVLPEIRKRPSSSSRRFQAFMATSRTRLDFTSWGSASSLLISRVYFSLTGRQFWSEPPSYRLPDPFDRHDWIVRRPQTGKMARYVIDYYGIKHPQRDTKLVIDARPALDSVDNARVRVVALMSRILSVVSAATTSVPDAVGRPVVKFGMCLLAIGISAYLSRHVSVI